MTRILSGVDNVATPVAIEMPIEQPGFSGFPRTHRGMLAANMIKGDARRFGVITGSPDIQPTYTRFVGGRDFITIPECETESFTLYMVIRMPEDGSSNDKKCLPFATWGPSAIDKSRKTGLVIRQKGSANLLCLAGQHDGSTASSRQSFVPYTPNLPLLLTMKGGNSYFGAFNRTQGGGTGADTFTAARDLSTSPIRIGSSAVGSVYRGSADVIWWRYYRRLHSDHEEAQMVKQIKVAGAAAGYPDL